MKPNHQRNRSEDFEKQYMDAKQKYRNKRNKEMMKTYSSLVFKTALIWTFIAVVIFLAQIFNEIILDQEMKMILWLQKELDVKSENVMLKGLNMLATFEGQQVFFYLWTLVLFYAVNSYIATKQFYVYFVANLFLIILQIFYQMPRPFWKSKEIVAQICNNSYSSPSFMEFNYLFYFIYLKQNVKEMMNVNGQKVMKVVSVIYYVWVVVLSVVNIVTGQNFIYDIMTGLAYFYLYYSLVTFFDLRIDSLITNLTVYKVQSKRQTYYAIILLLIITSALYLLTCLNPDTYMMDQYIINYLECINHNHQVSTIQTGTQMLGNAQNFGRLWIVFAIISVILGVAKSYRRFDNSFSQGTLKQRLGRVALAFIFFLPFCFLVMYQNYILHAFHVYITPLQVLIFMSIIAVIVATLSFEILPCYIFPKLNLIHDYEYYLLTEENSGLNVITQVMKS